MASQNNLLGYMIVYGSEIQLRGVALVTDVRGIPKEFTRTDALKPEPLERILYGDSFNTYAKENIILEALLDAIGTDPQIWICNDSAILEPLREKSKIKTVMLEESPHVPLDSEGSIEGTADPGVFMIQAYKNGAPLRAEFPEKTRPEEVQQVAQILTEAASTMSILEPFARLQKALAYISSGAR